MTGDINARVRLTGIARGLRQRQTRVEVRLWSRLRNRQLDNLKFRRQVPRGKFVADFLCDEAMLILEVDRSQHDEAPDKDAGRTAYLESLGYMVMRFRNLDVLQNTDRVLDHVQAVADERRKAPSSGPSGHLLPKVRRVVAARAECKR
jgi:very-short-patch-repair endonuclease